MTFPTQEIFNKIVAVATSPEAQEHLVKQCEAKFSPEALKKNRIAVNPAEMSILMDKLDELKQYAAFVATEEQANNQIWAGKLGAQNTALDTPFKNFQNYLADVSSNDVKNDLQGKLTVNIAIDNEGNILRGFADDGQQVNSNELKASLDTMVNAWFAENNIICQDSKLVAVDGNGAVNGAIKAEEVRALITNEDKGLAQYLKSKGVDVEQVANKTYPASAMQTATQGATSGISSSEPTPDQPSMKSK